MRIISILKTFVRQINVIVKEFSEEIHLANSSIITADGNT